MILTHDEILKQIQANRIVVSPYSEEAIGPASIDLTLGNEIRIFERIDHSIPVKVGTDYKAITRKIIIKEKYTIKPNELLLGITKEKITLPGNIAGWLNSRSRFARLGLMVHVTAPFVQPGISAHQVLEIYNTGPNNLDLIPGEKLCQLILEECKGSYQYKGKFKDQNL